MGAPGGSRFGSTERHDEIDLEDQPKDHSITASPGTAAFANKASSFRQRCRHAVDLTCFKLGHHTVGSPATALTSHMPQRVRDSGPMRLGSGMPRCPQSHYWHLLINLHSATLLIVGGSVIVVARNLVIRKPWPAPPRTI